MTGLDFVVFSGAVAAVIGEVFLWWYRSDRGW